MRLVLKLVAHSGKALVCGMMASLACSAVPRKPATAPNPELHVDLKPFGYRPISPRVAQSEATVMTVNFAGPNRLLVTFLIHKLLARQAEQMETDHDRMIHAVLLEWPSGKALAETDWRLHDAGRYLWPLSGGHFLLRSRNRLSLLSPATATGDEALKPSLLPALNKSSQQLVSVNVTSDGEMVSIQTRSAMRTGDDPDLPHRDGVDFRVYVVQGGNLEEVGHAALPHAVSPAYNAQGFLESAEDQPPFWGFDLHGFSGGQKELAAIESSCQPGALFVSPGEFLVSGCRGGDVHSMIGVLNVSGEVLWLGPGPTPVWGAISSAPSAERLAMRNTLSDSSEFADTTVAVGVRGQEVTVYRTYTGEKLLQVPVSPATQATQNFSISSDGLKLAVWSDDAVDVYTLAPVTAKDREMANKSSQPVVLSQTVAK